MKNKPYCAIGRILVGILLLIASSHPIHAESEVRFRLLRSSSIILVLVFIDNQGPFEFVFDTGADNTIFDSALVKRLSPGAAGVIRQGTIAGNWLAQSTEAATLRIGAVHLNRVSALVADLSGVRNTAPGAMGILGQNVLSHLNFLLDYGRQTIRFEAGDEIRSTVHGEAVPLDSAVHGMMVTAEPGKSGGTKLHLLLDSGANVLVLSHTAAGPAHVVLDANKIETTLNAKVVLPSGRIPELALGSRLLRNMPVTVSSAEQMEKICDGLLPMAFFKVLYVNNQQGFVEFLDRAKE